MFLEIAEAKFLNDFRMLVSFNNGESVCLTLLLLLTVTQYLPR